MPLYAMDCIMSIEKVDIQQKVESQQKGVDKRGISTYNWGISTNANAERRDWMMSEREKKILETLTTALPSMSEFDKGYLMGKGEAIMDMKRTEKKEEEKCIGRGEG